MKRILIIGRANYHMQRWCRYVIPEWEGDAFFDLFCISKKIIHFEGVNNVYGNDIPSFIIKILMRIPKLKGLIATRLCLKKIKSLIIKNNYHTLILHQPESWQRSITIQAKKSGCRIIITPWGSEVLRCSAKQRKSISEMFALADGVTCNIQGFKDQLMSLYKFDEKKIISAGFGSEILDLIPKIKEKFNKHKVAQELGIPDASYYIACGYTAQRGQKHLEMVEALIKNRDVLPKDTILLFQFTYGNNKDKIYQNEIAASCESGKLRYHFITTYLSNEDMAKFRLLIDLFIHIQPTDAGNSSLQEFLLAGSQCVNGKWLVYPKLEQDGLPYHICESVEQLFRTLNQFFTGVLPRLSLSKKTEEVILEGAWSRQKEYWRNII